MSVKYKRINFAIFNVLFLFLAYYSFMSFQALATLISKQGTLIFPFIWAIFGVIEMTFLTSYLYNVYFKREKIGCKYYKRCGIFSLVCSSLYFLFILINAINYNYNYPGPTFIYPFDFIIISLIGILVGVYALLVSKKKTNENEEKVSILKKIAFYFFIFIALDRLGVLLESTLNNPGRSFIFLLPTYLICLIPVLDIMGYTLYKYVKVHNKEKVWLIVSSLCFITSVVCILINTSLLYGSESTPFVKILSPFYGIDRLATLSLTMITVYALVVGVNLIAILQWFITRKKNKKVEIN